MVGIDAAPAEREVRPRTRIAHRHAFWVVGVAFFVLMASSAAPSPLYPVYQQAWGFSAITLTVIFAVYAAALLGTLLTVGSLSDHIGRKPVMVTSLVILIASLVLFSVADSVSMLIAARIVQGIAAGAATGALSAAVIDLQPNPSVGPLLNSVAPSFGLAGGALGAGLLVQLAPAPDVLVFALLIGAATILAVALLFVPETSALRGFDSRRHLASTLLPRATLPVSVRAPFLLIAPALFATWSLGGFHLSLGPSIIGTVFGIDNHIIGGLEIFALFASGAVSAAVVRNRMPRTVMMIGATVLATGVALTLVSVNTGSIALYFVGAVIAGSGWGATFLGAMRTLGELVPQAERGGVFATTFVISYLAFSVPAVVAGLAVHRLGLSTTVQIYGAVVITSALFSVLGFSIARHRGR